MTVSSVIRAVCVLSFSCLVDASFAGLGLIDELGRPTIIVNEIARLGRVNTLARTLIQEGLLTDEAVRATAQIPPAHGVAHASVEHIRDINTAIERLIDEAAAVEREQLISSLMSDFERITASRATSQDDLETTSQLLHRYMLDKRLGTLRSLRPLVTEIITRIDASTAASASVDSTIPSDTTSGAAQVQPGSASTETSRVVSAEDVV